MYVTDVIWWGFTAFLVATAVALLWFARKVQGTAR